MDRNVTGLGYVPRDAIQESNFISFGGDSHG
jgi:hypothetical protein